MSSVSERERSVFRLVTSLGQRKKKWMTCTDLSSISVLVFKYCNFNIECNKVMIELTSCNFGLKSYQWLQIKLVLLACSRLKSCQSHWYDFQLAHHFNHDFIALSLISTRHDSIALILENNIALPRNSCYNCYYTYHHRYRLYNYVQFFFFCYSVVFQNTQGRFFVLAALSVTFLSGVNICKRSLNFISQLFPKIENTISEQKSSFFHRDHLHQTVTPLFFVPNVR